MPSDFGEAGSFFGEIEVVVDQHIRVDSGEPRIGKQRAKRRLALSKFISRDLLVSQPYLEPKRLNQPALREFEKEWV